MSPLWVEDAVIGLETKLPPHGWVRTPLYMSHFIKNHSDYLITLRLSMEASDAFMFAGHKEVHFNKSNNFRLKKICFLPNHTVNNISARYLCSTGKCEKS